MLKSLEISGFKSFAKKTELHFKSQVTAIVGPNGSGKSNVAEAFRFALGEQSIKSMRGKRGEDLIWNGSEEVARSNRASVKVVLDNTKKFFTAITNSDENSGFDEVIIERVVNRDGGNEYYLNGSQVRLKDVFEILAKAHIGASGHHIISQGEADRILTAGSKERREMIEDALGLKIYQYKREESEKKLLKTKENIKQVESLRREIAPHIKFLKKQVEKVERAEELRQKLSIFYKEYLKREKFYIDTKSEVINNEKAPLEQKLEELEKQMENARNILSASSNKDEKSKDLLNIEDKIKESRNEKDRLYREIGKIEGEIKANKRSIEKIESETRSEEHKTILLSEVESLEKEISVFSEVSQIIERIRAFIRNHKNKINNGNLEELKSLNENLMAERIKVEEEIRKIDLSLKDLDSEYEQIKSSIEKEKDSSREAEKLIFKISGEQNEIRNRINILNIEIKTLKSLEEELKREIQEGGILLGTAVIGFENLELENLTEPREKQEERRRELEKMKIRLEELGGGGGSEIMKEYKETVERDEYLNRELEDLKKSAESLEILIKELLEKLDVEFNQGIEKINKSFQDFFVLMFGGGEAQLKIERLKTRKLESFEDMLEVQNKNPELRGNPSGRRSQDFYSETELPNESQEKIESGIEIAVSLPRKRIKGLEMLSGGERALTSIALLFAVSQVNPPPFIILDETDAALDEANSKKYGDMIEKLSKFSQLILITHNRETMSRAGIIYGVTMGRDGVSRLLSIAFDEAVSVAK